MLIEKILLPLLRLLWASCCDSNKALSYTTFSASLNVSHSVSLASVGRARATAPPMRWALVWRMISFLSFTMHVANAL